MKRWFAAGALLAVCLLVRPAGGQGGATPEIKEIMTRLNKPAGLYPALGRALKAENPAWNEVQAQTKEFAKLAAALGKNTPPKGDPASWQTLTTAYAANAAALEQATEKMDKAAAQSAYLKLGGATCGNCHKAHRK